MTYIDQIKQWIEVNHIAVEWTSERAFNLHSQSYLCVAPKDGKLFDAEFNILLGDEELQEILVDHYCFLFGGKVYTSPVKSEKIQLNLFKHVGKAKELTAFPYLGIHGGYELCNGSRVYEDWMEKAKFLGVEIAALAERHTLAGSLKFQQAAKKAGIKAIVGESITVKDGDDFHKIKLYVKDEIGWANLLRIHKQLNVDNNSTHVDFLTVLNHSEGLYCVIQNDVMLDDRIVVGYADLEKSQFAGTYFQFDPSEYKADNRELHCLNCLKNYFANYQDILPLALIIDSYYLDKDDASVRKILSFIGKGGFEFQSDDQYFKSFEDVALQTIDLFEKKGEEFAFEILEKALAGTNEIAAACKYQIKTGEIHLPKYRMTEEEAKHFQTNEELFWWALEQGIKKHIVEKRKEPEPYYARIESEYDVISRGGFQDYFLILRDIINWCEANDIMVGTGRGSAGGSLIALLLGVTKVDPLEYGLIFERFLNESRIGKGLPDIDTDFEASKRDRVKRYMEERFGKDNVCSIGTYSTLKSKAAFRDLLRFHGEEPQVINYYAAMIDDSNDDYHSLFQATVGNDRLKQFINAHLEAIQDVPLILGQQRSSSIHPAGVVVTPTIDKDGRLMQIYDWFPCKMMDGVLVSEWEGVQLDDGGFLKADILGLSQLDKLNQMLTLIQTTTNEPKIDLNEIDVKDARVFDEIFKKGLTQDIFQFGTDGLAAYCKDVEPESIDELAIMNALYRPGPMDSGAHTDYVKIKFGKKEPEYDWGTNEILASTYGLYTFQEQIIKMVQVLAGFTLTEGDGVRKATGKKDLEKMKSYRDKFVAGCVERGCEQYEADKIWNKIEVFAGYSFNLSHAVEYSLIGYQTAWIKYYYPLEFWTVSLQHAKDDEIAKRVAELRKFDTIKLYGPDVNKSKSSFFTDWESNTIYWSIGRIKHVGEVALNFIAQEKEKNGEYFSLEEFVKRCKSQAVNSRVVKHLIFSGCFDGIENIDHPMARKKLIDKFDQLYSVETEVKHDKFFWYKMQRNLSGFGYFDYSTLVDDFNFDYNEFVTAEQVQLESNVDCPVVIAGILTEIVKRKTKKGEMAKLIIDCNNDLIDVVLWNDVWQGVRKKIEEVEEGSGIMLNGKIQYDGYNKKNVVYSTDKTEVTLF